MTDLWIVMPVLAHERYTLQAIDDCLAQTVPCRVLVVAQGVEDGFRLALERRAEDSDRLFIWSHQPPLPSLAATWNRALDCAWAAGAKAALVVNNDVRLAPNTLELLDAEMVASGAYVVTGVGVGKTQFQPGQLMLAPDAGRGGPDFSCFLINHFAHRCYRFDEAFIPAYCEDIDFHRRLLLDRLGDHIYGVNVPFLHYGSTTLKTVDEKERARIERQTAAGARAHYFHKWGGAVNEERLAVPFDLDSDSTGLTTPELVEALRHGQADRGPDDRRHADHTDGDRLTLDPS